MNLNTINKSEIQSRMQIISILDPLKINTEYSTMTIEQLKEVLKKKTNSLNSIEHEHYQAIYDLPVDMPSRSNEVAILEFRISNMNIKIRELVETNEKLEEELLMSQMEIDKLRKTKLSRTPPREPAPEPNSFAAYIAKQEGEVIESELEVTERSDDLNRYVQKHVVQHVVGSKSPNATRPSYPVYAGYTPNKLPGFPDQSLFTPLIQQTKHFKAVNGELNADEAERLAIKESEILANAPLDAPFTRVSHTPKNDEDPFDKVDVEINATKIRKLTWRERDDRYDQLKDKPIGATNEILDRIYDYLLARDFEAVKIMLTTELNTEVVRWIRLLSYDGSNFKQMMVTKSHVIHKVFSGDN